LFEEVADEMLSGEATITSETDPLDPNTVLTRGEFTEASVALAFYSRVAGRRAEEAQLWEVA
jgi:hypothetical protein